jgi:hypothetical protein
MWPFTKKKEPEPVIELEPYNPKSNFVLSGRFQRVRLHSYIDEVMYRIEQTEKRLDEIELNTKKRD